MKLGTKGRVCAVLACAAMTYISSARAATATVTNYLGGLRAEISFRATNSPATNRTQRAQLAALRAAGNTLRRPAASYSGQLGQLATAATVLKTRFTNDTQLETLENNAIASYSDIFSAQWDEAMERIGTNRVQRGLSNQLMKAQSAYTNALANTNGVAPQARALAQAFNKLRIPFRAGGATSLQGEPLLYSPSSRSLSRDQPQQWKTRRETPGALMQFQNSYPAPFVATLSQPCSKVKADGDARNFELTTGRS